jgi:cell division protein FtsQ
MKPDGVTLSERYAWTVHLDDGSKAGMTVELGRERDSKTLIDRIDRLAAAYPLVTAKWPRLRLVDLRYPNGFAVQAEGVRVINDEGSRPRAVARPAPKHSAKPTTAGSAVTRPERSRT